MKSQTCNSRIRSHPKFKPISLLGEETIPYSATLDVFRLTNIHSDKYIQVCVLRYSIISSTYQLIHPSTVAGIQHLRCAASSSDTVLSVCLWHTYRMFPHRGLRQHSATNYELKMLRIFRIFSLFSSFFCKISQNFRNVLLCGRKFLYFFLELQAFLF